MPPQLLIVEIDKMGERGRSISTVITDVLLGIDYIHRDVLRARPEAWDFVTKNVGQVSVLVKSSRRGVAWPRGIGVERPPRSAD